MKNNQNDKSSNRFVGLVTRLTQSEAETFFGYIDTIDKGYMFFHSSQCQCESTLLKEGTPVTFDRVRSVKKGDFEVHNIQLLRNEKDRQLLEYNASSINTEIRIIAFCALLDQESTEQGALLIAKRKADIIKYHAEYALNLQDRYFESPSLIWLRKTLSPEVQIQKCLKILDDRELIAQINTDGIYHEISDAIIRMTLSTYANVNWSLLPGALITTSAFGAVLVSKFDDHLQKLNWPDLVFRDMPDVLISHEPIFKRLPAKYAIKYLQHRSDDTTHDCWKHLNTEARNQILLDYLRNGKSATAISIAVKDEKFDTLPSTTQAQVACSAIDTQFPCVWSKMSSVARRELLENNIDNGFLSAHAKYIVSDNETFSSISALNQVVFGWKEFAGHPELVWDKMSEEGRILALYRSIATKEKPFILDSMPRMGIETQVFSTLLKNASADKRNNAFSLAHEQFQRYVIESAWASTAPMRFDSFLAPCCSPNRSQVAYCEGRAWFTEEDRQNGSKRATRAYCPRTRTACELNSACYNGARIYPDVCLPWQQWSLSEILESLSICPCLPDLKTPEEYPARLAGWINRLNEIRERLRCSVCHEMMRPNFAYSKNLARFNTTVVSCVKGQGHDTDVYLNQCWGCDAIIDSRESRFKIDNYDICSRCGSGPQNSSTYSNGDVCPACGHRGMASCAQDSRSLKCEACHHTIRLPPAHKRSHRQ